MEVTTTRRANIVLVGDCLNSPKVVGSNPIPTTLRDLHWVVIALSAKLCSRTMALRQDSYERWKGIQRNVCGM